MKFRVTSRDLYRHAILLLCAKFQSNRTIGRWVIAKERFWKWRPSADLNFNFFSNLIIWLYRVPSMLLCTKLHRNLRRYPRGSVLSSRFTRRVFQLFVNSPCHDKRAQCIASLTLAWRLVYAMARNLACQWPWQSAWRCGAMRVRWSSTCHVVAKIYFDGVTTCNDKIAKSTCVTLGANSS